MTEPVPLSTVFSADDAGVIICAAGTQDFRVHKLLLSLVSPVFKDMFTLPQPPSVKPDSLPRIDVQDPPGAWENILRTIYPTPPNPTIGTIDDLESLLLAAHAYEMQPVIEVHQKAFENQEFIKKDPLRLFSIACACAFEDQASYVARNAELVKVTRRPDTADLGGLTLPAYRRLVSFLVGRDNEWQGTLGKFSVPWCRGGGCRGDSVALYNGIVADLRQPCLQVEQIYFNALERRSCCQSGCSDTDCVLSRQRIKGFVQEMIGKRGRVCDKFRPKEWYADGRALSRKLIY